MSVESQIFSRFLRAIGRIDTLPQQDLESLMRDSECLQDVDVEQFAQLLSALQQSHVSESQGPLYGAVFGQMLAARHRRAKSGKGTEEPETIRSDLIALYSSLSKKSALRGPVLAMLAVPVVASNLRAFVELVVHDPPLQSRASDLAFASLFQMADLPADVLFPSLLDGLQHLTVSAAILDLSNHLFRSGRIVQHPAAQRSGQLATLLGQIAQRLSRLEENPGESALEAEEIAEQVASSVQMAVSLCDALAQIGDQQFVGKLYQASEIRHRRLRTEAAAALVRLGETAGKQMLVELAAEPVARLRVLAYAKELDLLVDIPEIYRTATAAAEAELAAWLAEPSQFGLAPTKLELVDTCTQHWPGYEEPRDCYLFRFTYELPQAIYSNIGIAGPLTHSLVADLADLPAHDIYSAYAGWDARHEELFEIDCRQLPTSFGSEVARFERRLRDQGYDAVQPLFLGSFFGELALSASAQKDGQPGAAVVGENEIVWFPVRGSRRPLTPEDSYNIVKGRKLLRAFNG